MNTISNVKFIQGTDAINTYLADVRKYDVLTEDEEKELVMKAKAGDDKAKEQLILANQRYIYSQAKIYATDEDDVLDYVQQGNIGLILGIDAYDPEKGYRLLTIARWYIQREMSNYMNDDHNIINKSNQMKYGKRIEKIKNDFLKKEERYPSNEEIMELYKEKYDEEIKDVRDVYDLSVSSMSLNIDDDYTVEDTADFAIRTASFNEYDEECEKVDAGNNGDMANQLLSALPSKHSDILRKYYGIGGDAYSIDELAEEYNMYPAQMQKIIDKSIQYLKENGESIIEKTAL